MPLRLRYVRTSDGKLLNEALVTGYFASVGADELAGFVHPAVGPFEVKAHKRGYVLMGRGEQVQVDTYAMLDFGEVGLHCTVLRVRRNGARPLDSCPRCETPLTTEVVGGAYRSIATERRTCAVCECQVLSLSNAAEMLGAAANASSGWMRIESTMSCPTCGRVMTLGTLKVGVTTANVEACIPCQCVLLEPEDKRALELAAEQLP